MQTLKDSAVAAEREMIDPFFLWRRDYLNRAGTAKSKINERETNRDRLS